MGHLNGQSLTSVFGVVRQRVTIWWNGMASHVISPFLFLRNVRRLTAIASSQINNQFSINGFVGLQCNLWFSACHMVKNCTKKVLWPFPLNKRFVRCLTQRWMIQHMDFDLRFNSNCTYDLSHSTNYIDRFRWNWCSNTVQFWKWAKIRYTHRQATCRFGTLWYQFHGIEWKLIEYLDGIEWTEYRFGNFFTRLSENSDWNRGTFLKCIVVAVALQLTKMATMPRSVYSTRKVIFLVYRMIGRIFSDHRTQWMRLTKEKGITYVCTRAHFSTWLCPMVRRCRMANTFRSLVHRWNVCTRKPMSVHRSILKNITSMFERPHVWREWRVYLCYWHTCPSVHYICIGLRRQHQRSHKSTISTLADHQTLRLRMCSIGRVRCEYRLRLPNSVQIHIQK